MVVLDKKKTTCKIIDFAVPAGSSVEEQEGQKIGKHQDLRRELQKLWNVEVTIIELVAGSFGAIP